MTCLFHSDIRIYGRLILAAALFLSGLSQLPAQLSGVYKIGGYNPHYTTIRQAVSHLQSQGVSGPVRFDIRPGVYEEQVTLYPVWGSSNTNTITFRSETGNAGDVKISNYPERIEEAYIVRFDNARHFRLENLEFRANSSYYTRLIEVVNDVYDLQVIGCRLISPEVVSGVWEDAVLYLHPTTARKVEIRDNYITGGSHGILFRLRPDADSWGTVIAGNVVERFYVVGVGVHNLQGGSLTGNRIYEWSNHPYEAYGLSINNWTGTSKSPVLVANNYVSTSREKRWAVYIRGGKHLHFFHNTIKQTYGESAFYLDNTQYAKVINNIFYGGGYAANIRGNSTLYMNYNNFYSTGPYLARTEGISVRSLSAWSNLTGMDSRSINVDPQFQPQIHPWVKSPALVGAGLGVGVNEDIAGRPRRNPPCIGADEYKTSLTWPYNVIKLSESAKQLGYAAEGGKVKLVADLGDASLPVRSVFPNPVSDKLQVTLTDAYTGTVRLTVLDGLGRRVSQMDYEKVNSDLRAEFAVENLTPGVYQLQIREGREVAVERFVKR